MWRWLVVLALARGAWSCAGTPHCTCTSPDDTVYECQGANDTQFTLKTTFNYKVNVVCQGGDHAPCDLLPRVEATADGALPHLTTVRCSPALLPCLLRAVGARDVATLRLMDPRGPLRAEHLAGVQPTELLIFDAQPEWMSGVPSEALGALHELRKLRITMAGALRLQAGALDAAPALTFLELAADGLPALPPAAFRALKHLQQLQLWKNTIETVDRDDFEGLESLEELNLKENQLSALAPGVFSAMPRLRVLALEGNRFPRLGPGVFTGPLLENITLHDNRANLTLEDLTFANMSSLRHLLLHYSNIESVPAELLRGSEGLVSLDLSHNRLAALPPALFQGLAALAVLDLSYNRIAELPARLFLPLKGLVHLNLNRNYIQVLPDRLFSGLRNFKRLSIDDNELDAISKDAFLGVDSLLDVSLARNRLALRREGYLSFQPYSPFWHLRNLRTLVLRGNRLTEVFLDWTDVLAQLTALDLSYNNFTDLDSSHLQFLGLNTVVDLRHNDISTVTITFAGGPPSDSRALVLLEGNPLHCDCFAYRFSLAVRGRLEAGGAAPRFDPGAALCASPPDKRERRFAAVRPDELACDLGPRRCPAACDSCAMRPATEALEMSCEVLPETLPSASEFYFKRIKLRLRDVTGLRTLPDVVSSLNVSGIGLRELKLPVPSHLEELDLRHNLLKTVPDYVLNSNITLYLADNSLECECEYADYIRLLKARPNVGDASNVTCADGRRLADEVSADALCAVRRAALLAGAVLLALVALAVALAVLVYRYRYEMLVYLTSRGYLKWLLTEEVLDADKSYDVFVAFSHRDVAFVQDELMPKLEEEFKLRTCVHYRDWVVGDLIPTQVVRSVERSRKTLIVLSRNFAKSAWAGMEFRAAHCLALKEGRARVVLVVLDHDVLADKELDEDLRAYLTTNTYLQRGDAKFWERLRRAVTPRDRKFTFLGKFRRGGGGGGAGAGGKTGGGGGGGGLDVQLNRDGQLVNAALGKDYV